MKTIDACTQLTLHNAWNVERLLYFRKSKQLIVHNPSRWHHDASKNINMLLKKEDTLIIAPKKYHIEEETYALQKEDEIQIVKDFCRVGTHLITREPVHEPHILIHDATQEFQECPSYSTLAIVGHPYPKNIEMCRNMYFNGIQEVDWNPRWLLAGIVSPMILCQKYQYTSAGALNFENTIN